MQVPACISGAREGQDLVETGLTSGTLAKLASQAELGDAGVVVEEIAPPGRAGLQAARASSMPLSPASMIKMPLAAAVYALVESGVLDPSLPVPVHAANMTANDAASPLVPGYASSVPELVRLMVARSDNVATNELVDLAGRERANEIVHGLGLVQTFIRRKLSGSDPLIDDPGSLGRNAHPADDSARLFRLIAKGELAGAGAIMSALREQVWNDKLSAGWRKGDRFAHKTGETSEVSHDGGILTTRGGRQFIIVVYTPLPAGPAADRALANFAGALRSFLD